jgi:UDP-N-acetyl-D-glucosamine/UDP-N-acetyl-D-galactosamine dehydrogenase
VNYNIQVDVIDPHADSHELEEEYGFGLVAQAGKEYDAVIVAVNHREYVDLEEAYFLSITRPNAVMIDVKGIYRRKITKLQYWSL